MCAYIDQIGVGEAFRLGYTETALHLFTGSNAGPQAGPVILCAGDRAQSTVFATTKEGK
jgi:hypothetical protein